MIAHRDLADRLAAVVADHPEVPLDEIGGRLARLIGEGLGADRALVDAVEAEARAAFGALDRELFTGPVDGPGSRNP